MICRCLDLTAAEWQIGDDYLCSRCGREARYDRGDRRQGWGRIHHLARSICVRAGVERRDAYLHPEVQKAIDRLYPCDTCHRTRGGGERFGFRCDPCQERLDAERAARDAALARTVEERRPREPLGEWQPDGKGCVEKTSLAERVWMSGGGE